MIETDPPRNGIGSFVIDETRTGYVEALASVGIEVDGRLVRLDLHNVEEAEACVSRLLRLERPLTGVVASGNRRTIGVVRAQAKAGRSLSVVDFDDFGLADLLRCR